MKERDGKGKYKTLPNDFNPDAIREGFLLAHYKRCEEFWRHWTPSIWSIPTAAATINGGAYALLQKADKDSSILVLTILVALNFVLTMGLWKHRYMQQIFGTRIQDIERLFSVPPIEFSGIQKIL